MTPEETFSSPFLEALDPATPHSFENPSKRISEHQDVPTFLCSLAYKDITTFILQLNRSVVPEKAANNETQKIQTWPLGSEAVEFSEPVKRLQLLLEKLNSLIDEVPPDKGPRRFGNISFRKWYQEMQERSGSIMDECLPSEVLQYGTGSADGITAKAELMAYLSGSFGSSQRLDYGTGHELSFLAFLGCLWKLNAFPKSEPGVEERGIVLGVIEPYLRLIRRLILTYTLEPAGSHGVWGLDDHSFVPYILGSAQFAPAVSPSERTPTEGSIDGAPKTSDVTQAAIVNRERETNMYFSAIGFINDVKRGPFWEHSPMLFDISGIKDGWAKINKGMIKMYNAEVLSKFPVVQHFPFGSLFRWERDQRAATPPLTAHLTPPPRPGSTSLSQTPQTSGDAGTRAPWAAAPSSRLPLTSMHPSSGPGGPRNLPGPTRAPWASKGSSNKSTELPPAGGSGDSEITTKAPWAKQNK